MYAILGNPVTLQSTYLTFFSDQTLVIYHLH